MLGAMRPIRLGQRASGSSLIYSPAKMCPSLSFFVRKYARE
jgi:hypothetical protein